MGKLLVSLFVLMERKLSTSSVTSRGLIRKEKAKKLIGAGLETDLYSIRMMFAVSFRAQWLKPSLTGQTAFFPFYIGSGKAGSGDTPL